MLKDFQDIREFTNRITPHPGEFVDLHGFFCWKEDKLSLDCHHPLEFDNLVDFAAKFKTRCCKEVLIHCLKSYDTKGWFFPNEPKHIYCFVHYNRFWRHWEDFGVFFGSKEINVSGSIQGDRDFYGYKY